MTTQCPVHDSNRGQPKRGTLTKAVEQREVVRRAQEASRVELEKFYAAQPAILHIEKNVMYDDLKRREREAKERAIEGQMLDSLYQAEKARELALIRSDEEEKIATVLAKRSQEKERKEREIQQLREQSSELRDLAEKIRTAKMNKDRAVQLEEKATLKQQHAEYEETMHKYVDQVEAAAEVRHQEFEARKRDQAVKARMVLEEQMAEKQDALKLAEDEYQKERSMVDEIVRRIQAEDAADARLRHQKQEETKDYIARFLEDKNADRLNKIVAEQEEDRKIKEHWNMVRDREAAESERKAQAKEVADRMYEKVKLEMETDRRRREEEEELINLLRQEELELKRTEEEAAVRRKAERLKAEIMRANEQQKKLKEEREAAYQAEEEEFRRQLLAKFAEDDRIEQMNQQKRRMKLVEHQRAVQSMIDDKRRMYMEQKARDEAAIMAQRAEEDRRSALVEGERKRLLAEAASLRQYLPRGVIRDQADLDYINQVLAAQRLAS